MSVGHRFHSIQDSNIGVFIAFVHNYRAFSAVRAVLQGTNILCAGSQ